MRHQQVAHIIRQVQVNIPFRMLSETYLPVFIDYGLNPEIGIDADAIDSYTTADFERIADQFHRKERSITLHGPFLDLSPGSRDIAIRDVTRSRLAALIDLVKVFSPRTVVCHAGYDQRRYGFYRQEWLDSNLAFWSWVGKEVKSAGARLMLENVYEERPEDLLALFDGLKGADVGFCLDPGHQSAFSKAPLAEWLSVLGETIGQVHLHDNHGDTDAHLALGQGQIPLDQLFAYLNDHVERQIVLTLEPHEEEDLWPSLTYLEAYLGAGASARG